MIRPLELLGRLPLQAALAALLALTAAACSELTPPEAYAPTTSSTTPRPWSCAASTKRASAAGPP